MKRKNFLILLAAGCLFSCQQQDELQETSKEATNFSISIDDALSDPLTRTSNDLFPARNSITTGEVISMAASGQDYTPFIVGKDSRMERNRNCHRHSNLLRPLSGIDRRSRYQIRR